MRTALRTLAALAIVLSALDRRLVSAAAAPCVTGTVACTEWIALGGGPARSLVGGQDSGTGLT